MAPAQKSDATNRPNCLQCRHFFVDWTPPVRRGCRAYEFSCDDYPSAEVLRASGEPCKLFAPRRGAGNADAARKRRFS